MAPPPFYSHIRVMMLLGDGEQQQKSPGLSMIDGLVLCVAFPVTVCYYQPVPTLEACVASIDQQMSVPTQRQLTTDQKQKVTVRGRETVRDS
jgi:hypothetical protein